MLYPETLPVREAGGKLRSRIQLLTVLGVGVRGRKGSSTGEIYRQIEITRQQGRKLLCKEQRKKCRMEIRHFLREFGVFN